MAVCHRAWTLTLARRFVQTRHCLHARSIRMVNKHCAYGTCNSDSRHMHKPHMEGVGFVYFPQSKKDPDKCSRWVKLCGRPSEGYRSFAAVTSVTKDTYICTKHFVGGQGPTFECPDPIPASEVENKLSERKKRRQPPKQRPLTS